MANFLVGKTLLFSNDICTVFIFGVSMEGLALHADTRKKDCTPKTLIPNLSKLLSFPLTSSTLLMQHTSWSLHNLALRNQYFDNSFKCILSNVYFNSPQGRGEGSKRWSLGLISFAFGQVLLRTLRYGQLGFL